MGISKDHWMARNAAIQDVADDDSAVVSYLTDCTGCGARLHATAVDLLGCNDREDVVCPSCRAVVGTLKCGHGPFVRVCRAAA